MHTMYAYDTIICTIMMHTYALHNVFTFIPIAIEIINVLKYLDIGI